VSPKPVVTIVIETAVKSARTMSAAHATDVEGIAASTSTPTPALPPVPWTRPIPNAPIGERNRMVMVLVLVGVCVQVEVAVPPADEEPIARNTISAATAVSAPCCIRSGRNCWKRRIGSRRARA
jgi:hypothetical protein